MSIPDWLVSSIQSQYTTKSNYKDFSKWIKELVDAEQIKPHEADDIFQRFPNSEPILISDWEDEEGVETILRDPLDTGPLAKLPFRSWIKPDLAGEYRHDDEKLIKLLGMNDLEVIRDIQENALHILDGCNNPTENGEKWGENKQGLVYGMVQSGKTANMLSLISIARKSGYRLFIILSGDKSSLRNQTQNRINKAFKLDNGSRPGSKIHSPTFNSDFKHTRGGYTANFRFNERVARSQDWTTIIVIKKQTNHLNSLINQIKDLEYALKEEGMEMGKEIPTMIIDDEADYASQNTDTRGDGTTIHNDLISLRRVLPRNCYVAYTATPQACLTADPDDPIGYPKDFWWHIEPYMDEHEGGRIPRSYLGAWEVFWFYNEYLINRMGMDEWPNHVKDVRGAPLGVWMPPIDENHIGTITTDLVGQEEIFLQEIEDGNRNPPESIQKAMLDFIISCGIRWWREWNKSFDSVKPSRQLIERDYPYHSMMIHLSLTKENQEKIRNLASKEWPKSIKSYRSFNPENSSDDHPFMERWRLQKEKSSVLMDEKHIPFEEIRYFIDRCIEIVEEPIKNHNTLSPYQYFNGKPWIYLLNSSDEGMELNYSKDADREIRTKKAAIVVGGYILSRGLTIEGLSTTIFCRTQALSMGDTNMQMGRWFGHKMKERDLISIHMQDCSLEIFRQIAQADRYLRLQIKLSLEMDHSPLRVLLELRNSPFFRSTSRDKSAFLGDTNGTGFSGHQRILKKPDFEREKIDYNKKLLDSFQNKNESKRALNRALLYKNVELDATIALLKKFKCKRDAPQTSFKQYADYLEEWSVRAASGELAQIPQINIAIWDEGMRQREQKYTNFPGSEEQARKEVRDSFNSIIGGSNDNKKYMGDAFIDKPQEWHDAQINPSKIRNPGDPILIIFYQLKPNYVRKSYYNKSLKTSTNSNGTKIKKEIYLIPGDDLYMATINPIIVFACWTPIGGPMYQVGTNLLINPNTAQQIGLNIVNSDSE